MRHSFLGAVVAKVNGWGRSTGGFRHLITSRRMADCDRPGTEQWRECADFDGKFNQIQSLHR
jgi:hypothetical protein